MVSPSTKDAEMSKRVTTDYINVYLVGGVTLKDFWIMKTTVETEPVKKKAKQDRGATKLTETIDRVADVTVTSRTIDLDDNEAEKLSDSAEPNLGRVIRDNRPTRLLWLCRSGWPTTLYSDKK